MQSKYDSLNLHEEMNRLTSILARTYKEQNINYSLEPPKQSNLSGLSTITVNYQISNSDGFEAIGTINLLLCRTGTIMIGEERTTGFAMSEHSAAFSKLLESFTCNWTLGNIRYRLYAKVLCCWSLCYLIAHCPFWKVWVLPNSIASGSCLSERISS